MRILTPASPPLLNLASDPLLRGRFRRGELERRLRRADVNGQILEAGARAFEKITAAPAVTLGRVRDAHQYRRRVTREDQACHHKT